MPSPPLDIRRAIVSSALLVGWVVGALAVEPGLPSKTSSTLRFIREHSAPGSKVVFDYTLASDARLNDPATRFARWGEPWIFGFPGKSAVDSLRQAGLMSLTDMSMSELATTYAKRQDGTSTLPTFSDDQGSRRMCIAQVPEKSQ